MADDNSDTTLMTDPIQEVGGQQEQQPAGDVKPGSTEPTKAEPAPGDTKPTEPVAPEAYEFKMPEGVTLDPDSITDLSTIAKELKLTQEQAQKIVDIGGKSALRALEKQRETVKGWRAEIAADKELGGDKLPQNAALADKALTLAPPELRPFLKQTGLGNHPLLFKWAVAIGQKLSEDSFVAGSNAPAKGNTEEEVAARLFPTMNTKR